MNTDKLVNIKDFDLMESNRMINHDITKHVERRELIAGYTNFSFQYDLRRISGCVTMTS